MRIPSFLCAKFTSNGRATPVAREQPYHITRAGNAFQICILERVPAQLAKWPNERRPVSRVA
jgi:hypothetical protein